ncbi:hypothetical protein Tco_1189772 [Tanacetum coccineum]
MLIELINSSGLSKDKPVKSMGSLPLLDPLPKAFKSKVVKPAAEGSSPLLAYHAPSNLCHWILSMIGSPFSTLGSYDYSYGLPAWPSVVRYLVLSL